jgi:hypothetical protein
VPADAGRGLLLPAAAGRYWARYGPALVRPDGDAALEFDWIAALVPFWGLYWNAWITLPYHLGLALVAGEVGQPLYRTMGIEVSSLQVFVGMCIFSAIVKGRVGTQVLVWHLHRRVARIARREGAGAAAALAEMVPDGRRIARHVLLTLCFGWIGWVLVNFGTEYIKYRLPRTPESAPVEADAAAR